VHLILPEAQPASPVNQGFCKASPLAYKDAWGQGASSYITLVLHVEPAPTIDLTFDGSEPFLVARARPAITDQAPVLDPDNFASAVELAAGALLKDWMQRDAWPPDVRPAEGGSRRAEATARTLSGQDGSRGVPHRTRRLRMGGAKDVARPLTAPAPRAVPPTP
jgi:hypothetical protein